MLGFNLVIWTVLNVYVWRPILACYNSEFIFDQSFYLSCTAISGLWITDLLLFIYYYIIILIVAVPNVLHFIVKGFWEKSFVLLKLLGFWPCGMTTAHAVLLKRGYIMFTISPNYLPQLYHFTEHYVRTLHTDNYYFSYRVAAAVALKRSVEALVSLDFDSAEI